MGPSENSMHEIVLTQLATRPVSPAQLHHPSSITLRLPNSSHQYLKHDLSAGMTRFAQLLRFAGFCKHSCLSVLGSRTSANSQLLPIASASPARTAHRLAPAPLVPSTGDCREI